jgi:hypothetical protein
MQAQCIYYGDFSEGLTIFKNEDGDIQMNLTEGPSKDREVLEYILRGTDAMAQIEELTTRLEGLRSLLTGMEDNYEDRYIVEVASQDVFEIEGYWREPAWTMWLDKLLANGTVKFLSVI